MKKLGISLDGVIRNFHSSFDRQYRKTFIMNPAIVQMDEDFRIKEPTEEEIKEQEKRVLKLTAEKISLPIDTYDLLNHYEFNDVPEFQNETINKIRTKKEKDAVNRILTPEEALNQFMYEKYPFRIFGDSEEYQNATNYFNQIQAYGLRNKLFETVLLIDVKGSAITASYYFLHKTGNRARNIKVVESNIDKWEYCDVLIDVEPEVIQSKPKDKKLVKIERVYNQWDQADYSLKDLKFLNDEELLKILFK